MNKHTPGPWRYWTQRRNPEDTCTFQSAKGTEVLRAVTVTVTEADARLIAASPDLLEALQEMMLYAGIIEECCDSVAVNKARLAIVKATGEIK